MTAAGDCLLSLSAFIVIQDNILKYRDHSMILFLMSSRIGFNKNFTLCFVETVNYKLQMH
jgi:hypothetical protein